MFLEPLNDIILLLRTEMQGLLPVFLFLFSRTEEGWGKVNSPTLLASSYRECVVVWALASFVGRLTAAPLFRGGILKLWTELASEGVYVYGLLIVAGPWRSARVRTYPCQTVLIRANPY